MSIGPGSWWEQEDAEEPALLAPDVDASRLAEYELVADMREALAFQGQMYARDLEAVAGWAARRRRRGELATVDGRGGPGVDSRALADVVLAGVAEDFVAELALARGCSEAEAAAVLREALLLTGPLSQTWSRLFAGLLSVRHAKAAVDLLGDATPQVAAAVQARVLPGSEGLTAARFRDRLRYHLYRIDAAAKQRRRREALRRIGVHVRRLDEGVSELVVQGPTPAVHAAADAVDQYAQMRRADGDTRPIGVLRAGTALDLILRPWDTSRPPVTAHLVVHASARALRPDGDPAQTQTPAELDGQVISAAECRDLLRDLDMLHLADPPAGGSVLIAVDDPATGETVAVATRAELRRAAGVGRTRQRRHRTGRGLFHPPDTTAYQPTAAQKRLVKVRDRCCRMPGCARRVGRCDLDHADPYDDGGPTACWNLCCLCKKHHRIKTFAPGWSFTLLRDGTLVVRTPAGITRRTRPPGWYPDPEPDPPWLDEQAPPDLLRQ
jgi:hypothetical protein